MRENVLEEKNLSVAIFLSGPKSVTNFSTTGSPTCKNLKTNLLRSACCRNCNDATVQKQIRCVSSCNFSSFHFIGVRKSRYDVCHEADFITRCLIYCPILHIGFQCFLNTKVRFI